MEVAKFARDNPIALGDTLLRFYGNVPDPSALSDDEWEGTLKCIQFIRQEEAKNDNGKV